MKNYKPCTVIYSPDELKIREDMDNAWAAFDTKNLDGLRRWLGSVIENIHKIENGMRLDLIRDGKILAREMMPELYPQFANMFEQTMADFQRASKAAHPSRTDRVLQFLNLKHRL